jgi:hypothetical protein
MKVANIALGAEPGRRVSVSEKGPLSATPPVARMPESDASCQKLPSIN